MSSVPDSAGTAGPRAVASTRTREAFFDSLSRELRCTLDEAGRFLHLEGAWEAVLGWPTNELLGLQLMDVAHPADRGRMANVVGRLRDAGGCEDDLLIRVAVRGGGYQWVAWTLGASLDPDCVIALGHADMEPLVAHEADSLLKRRTRDLEARVVELERRCAAVEGFAGTAAHELAEPLIIAESSSILVREALGNDLDPFLAERLDAIGRSAARARGLIDAVLQDARSAREPVDLVRVSLNRVVQESVANLEPRREELGATFKLGRLPDVSANASLLSVVIDNLLANALKHGPRKGGQVSLTAKPVPEGWRLDIGSEGPPIGREEARTIFEPFRRGPGERRVSGTGLGLAICARIIERLGGDIGVRPGRDGGNTFWIVLPAAT